MIGLAHAGGGGRLGTVGLYDRQQCYGVYVERVVMKFLVNGSIKPEDFYRRLMEQIAVETLSRSGIFQWCKRFKDGCLRMFQADGQTLLC